jgi:nitrate reductase delta subunit
MAIYSFFAEILDYPEHSIAKSLDDCAAALAVQAPDAHLEIMEFCTAVSEMNLGQLQEVYANAFDLRPDCTPNLGYHLFGDDGRRGLFLVELKERMEAHKIQFGVELPDHIALILRYLELAEEDRLPLIEDCLLPTVSRMVEVLDHTGNPYEHVLRALLSLLRRQHDAFAVSALEVEV